MYNQVYQNRIELKLGKKAHFKYYITSFLFLIIIPNIYSQSPDTLILQYPNENGLYFIDVYIVSTDTMVAISKNGVFLSSIDGGAHWKSTRVDSVNLKFLSYIDAGHIWVCTADLDNPRVYFSSNFGDTWTKIFTMNIQSSLVESPRRFHFVNEKLGYFYSSNLFGYTIDGGYSWKGISLVYNSQQIINPAFGGIAWIEDGLCFLAISGGGLYRSTDGGAFWRSISKEPPNTFLGGIDFFDHNRGYTYHYYRGYETKKTEDGGKTWNIVPVPTDGDVVTFETWNRGIVSGRKTYITTDGGNNWVNLRQTGKARFITDNFGIVYSGYMLKKTLNSGISWQTLSSLPEQFIYINTIHVSLDGTGIAVGDNTKNPYVRNKRSYLYTTNFGNDWVLKNPDNEFSPLSFSFYQDKKGYGLYRDSVTLKWSVIQTSDGGIHWTYFSGILPLDTSRVKNSPKRFWSFSEKSFAFLTDNERIIFSQSRGANWSVIDLTGEQPKSVFIYNDTILYISTGRSFQKSVDFGNTWIHYENPPDIYGFHIPGFNQLYFFNAEFGYGRFLGKVYKTTNGGLNWEIMPTEDAGAGIMDFKSGNLGYFVTVFPNRGITKAYCITEKGSKWTPHIFWGSDYPGTLSAVTDSTFWLGFEGGGTVPGSIRMAYMKKKLTGLDQKVPAIMESDILLYPNPAFENKIVHITIHGASIIENVRLTIVDVHGRTLYSTRVKSKGKMPLTIPVRIDRFESGIFFCRIRLYSRVSEEWISYVKKFVVIR